MPSGYNMLILNFYGNAPLDYLGNSWEGILSYKYTFQIHYRVDYTKEYQIQIN